MDLLSFIGRIFPSVFLNRSYNDCFRDFKPDVGMSFLFATVVDALASLQDHVIVPGC